MYRTFRSKPWRINSDFGFVAPGEAGVTPITTTKEPNNCRIVSWNTLANQYIHQHREKRPNANGRIFCQEFRHALLQQSFQHFVDIDVDFLCLQEVDYMIARQTLVDRNSYTRLLTPTGYGRGPGDTRVDACCIFYKSKKWNLLYKKIVHLDDLADQYGESFRRGSFGIIACFQHISNPNRRITICNTHLYWNEKFKHVKLRQAHYLCTQAKKFLNKQGKKNGMKNNFVLCGDLNSKPGGLVHTYLSKGKAYTVRLPSFNKHVLKCPLRHLLLKSIHAKHDDRQAENIEYTICTPDFRRVIDYIFYPQSLHLEKVLSIPVFRNNEREFGTNPDVIPNTEWPSDHLAIGAEFSFQELHNYFEGIHLFEE